MFIYIVLNIINILHIFDCKNVVLPFKKITIETFKNDKTINDLITYNIFTTIELCTNTQFVGFFIEQNEASFYLAKRLLSFNSTKSNDIMKLYQNMSDFWFDKYKSEEIGNCDYNQFCSEVFYFNTLKNNKVLAPNFRFNIYYDFIIERYKCGIIGFKNPSNKDYEDGEIYIYYFDELKNNNLIDQNYFTILYEENNDIFNYNDSLYLGKIIIGESPHIFAPEKFIKKDEIIIPGNDYVFMVNELKFNTTKGAYSENNVEIQISLTSGFIKGTHLYKQEIENTFFEDLIKKELCQVEYLSENIYTNEYYIYSCKNDKNILEALKQFPPLYFEIKTKNLTFVFTKNDLFKQFKNRIYFLIAFLDEKFSTYSLKWYFGDIFLRKYMTSFNFDSKSISFYRNQVDNANLNSIIYYDENELKKKSNIFNILRTLIEICMGIFIIMMLFIFYRKIRGKRKLHANELEDNNFEYEPKKETKLILIDKEGNEK